MDRDLSDADRRFLVAAAEDIQRRLRGVAVVESIATLSGDGDVVQLVVTVRAGSRRLEYRGQGEGLTDAFRALLVAAMHGPPHRQALGCLRHSGSTIHQGRYGRSPIDRPAPRPDDEQGIVKGTRMPAPA